MTSTPTRRSDRLLLSIPLRAEGLDTEARPFESSALTVNLNRYGAQIKFPQRLREGQPVRLTNLLSRRGAQFRWVELLSIAPTESWEYGVECLDANENIWAINFPDVTDAGRSNSMALLVCRICEAVALEALSPGELEALRSIGIVAKECKSCQAVTARKYAELPGTHHDLPNGEWSWAFPKQVKQRQHRRVYLQIPISLRDQRGEVEGARTETFSRGGFSFASEKRYDSGEVVDLFLPGEPGQAGIELSGRILWVQSIAGSKRKLYGVRYES